MINPINTDIIKGTGFRTNLMSSTRIEKSEHRANIVSIIIDTPIALHLQRINNSTDNLLLLKIEQLNQKSN